MDDYYNYDDSRLWRLYSENTYWKDIWDTVHVLGSIDCFSNGRSPDEYPFIES